MDRAERPLAGAARLDTSRVSLLLRRHYYEFVKKIRRLLGRAMSRKRFVGVPCPLQKARKQMALALRVSFLPMR
jgi:hypothetical protein